MKSRLLPAVLLLAAGSILLWAQAWQIAQPGYRFEFPRDHFSHPDYETEWWYYTGNLRSAEGHRYGFELVFFRQAQKLSPQVAEAEDPVWRPDQIYLAHLALSDIDGQQFFHTERLNRAGPGLAGAGEIDGRYWNGNWQVRWTALPEAAQQLEAVSDHFTLKLNLKSDKPPVIHGQNGVSVKGAGRGQASHYISFTRLAATGQLESSNKTSQVSGLAWMDHEFFTEPPQSDLAGWDWFAIQLDSNEELMLYRLRRKSGDVDPFSSGSYVDPQGHVRFLSTQDFTLASRTEWQSPQSGARYPVSWQISVPSLALLLLEQTDLKNQELWSSGHRNTPGYWEGAVSYTGTLRAQPTHGVGYLEMTGYREAIQLSGMAGR